MFITLILSYALKNLNEFKTANFPQADYLDPISATINFYLTALRNLKNNMDNQAEQFLKDTAYPSSLKQYKNDLLNDEEIKGAPNFIEKKFIAPLMDVAFTLSIVVSKFTLFINKSASYFAAENLTKLTIYPLKKTLVEIEVLIRQGKKEEAKTKLSTFYNQRNELGLDDLATKCVASYEELQTAHNELARQCKWGESSTLDKEHAVTLFRQKYSLELNKYEYALAKMVKEKLSSLEENYQKLYQNCYGQAENLTKSKHIAEPTV